MIYTYLFYRITSFFTLNPKILFKLRNRREKKIMQEAVSRLKAMLSWSDRLGSDEKAEISEVIALLNKDKNANKS